MRRGWRPSLGAGLALRQERVVAFDVLGGPRVNRLFGLLQSVGDEAQADRPEVEDLFVADGPVVGSFESIRMRAS